VASWVRALCGSDAKEVALAQAPETSPDERREPRAGSGSPPGAADRVRQIVRTIPIDKTSIDARRRRCRLRTDAVERAVRSSRGRADCAWKVVDRFPT